jgi:hypothetical protein
MRLAFFGWAWRFGERRSSMTSLSFPLLTANAFAISDNLPIASIAAAAVH